MDNLIPIVVALVGILIIYLLFKHISDTDVEVTAVTAVRKPHPKKAAAPAANSNTNNNNSNNKPKINDDNKVLDEAEMEALVARDMARHQAQPGMHADTKRVQPETLEMEHSRRLTRTVSKNAAAALQAEKEAVKDKEDSFHSVPYSTRQQRKNKDLAARPEDDISQKLMNFFKNNKSQMPLKGKNNVEVASPKTDAGGHVLTYGALNMARSWNDVNH